MNNGILIAADEITRRVWHTCSLLSTCTRMHGKGCISPTLDRMIMNFWDKQVALMKMLGNSASNGRG